VIWLLENNIPNNQQIALIFSFHIKKEQHNIISVDESIMKGIINKKKSKITRIKMTIY